MLQMLNMAYVLLSAGARLATSYQLPNQGIDGATSFESIAQAADFSAEKLALFLLEPHPRLPNMSLSRKEAQDNAAYIAIQRR